MRIIAPVAVIAIVLLELSGAVGTSSVGGPLTLMLAFVIAALAVGIHDAWTNGRGVLGWFGSIIAVLVGAFAAAGLGGMIMETVLMHVNLGGSLASSRSPLLYVSLAGMMLLTLLGAWIALWIMNRFR